MRDPKKILPHREPFYFIDELIDQTQESITTVITFDERHYFLKGHFPGNPVVPGVILCEALFQTGALLMGQDCEILPVVTRIQNAKFKTMARPNEKIRLYVQLKETLSNAFYMKGKAYSDSATFLSLDFSCALIDQP